MLDTLKVKKVSAAFFVLGETLPSDELKDGKESAREVNAKILVRMHSEGHTVGAHTFSHPDLMATESSIIKKELSKTNFIIKKLLGQRPRYFRAPYG